MDADAVSPEPRGRKRLDRDAPTVHLVPFIDQGRADSVFEVLVLRYQNELLLTARHAMGPRLSGRYSPHDIVQEAWMRIVKEKDRLARKPSGALRQWLKVEIRRIAIDHARKHGARHDLVSPMTDRGFRDAPPPVPASGQGPSSEAATQNEVDRLYEALMDRERTTDLHREVIVGLVLEERDLRELSAERGVSSETLRKQLYRAKQRLRQTSGIEF